MTTAVAAAVRRFAAHVCSENHTPYYMAKAERIERSYYGFGDRAISNYLYTSWQRKQDLNLQQQSQGLSSYPLDYSSIFAHLGQLLLRWAICAKALPLNGLLLERQTRFELATACLEGKNSTN